MNLAGYPSCTICGLHYRSVDTAKACQEFCTENNACSLEIIQKALESEEQHESKS